MNVWLTCTGKMTGDGDVNLNDVGHIVACLPANISSASCTSETLGDCSTLGGSFGGIGSTCNVNSCNP